MSTDILDRTDGGTLTFDPAAHLIGVLQRIKTSGKDTLIVLPNVGEIAVLPKSGEFYTNLNAENMERISRAPAEALEVSALPYAPPVNARKDLKQLLWTATFHASQGRLIQGCSKYDLVQFSSWPNLTRLPNTPNAARICALLTRHPTTIMWVARKLEITKEEVYQIYSAANSAGLVNALARSAKSQTEEQPENEAPARSGMFRSLFAKITGL